MSLKTSAAQKANYSRYKTENRASKNKAAKIARHMKSHPNDGQSSAQRAGARAGFSNDRLDPLFSKVDRAVMHEALFGSKVKVNGRDLSTAVARKELMKPAKKAA